jgi:hypothetical protein
LQIAQPSTFGARNGRHETARINIIGINLAAIAHQRTDAERLATATSAIIQHLSARYIPGGQRSQLRTQILHFQPALGVSGNGGHMPVTIGRIRHGQAQGCGDEVTGFGFHRLGGFGGALNIGSQRVDAKINWGTACHGVRFGHGVIAKHFTPARP